MVILLCLREQNVQEEEQYRSYAQELHPGVSAKAQSPVRLCVLGNTEPQASPNKEEKWHLHEEEMTLFIQRQKRKCTFQNDCKYHVTLAKNLHQNDHLFKDDKHL